MPFLPGFAASLAAKFLPSDDSAPSLMTWDGLRPVLSGSPATLFSMDTSITPVPIARPIPINKRTINFLFLLNGVDSV
jgi:hypothetical protein